MADIKKVAVASYNMSFMSDKSFDPIESNFASEAAFINSNPDYMKYNEENQSIELEDNTKRRQYWENAKKLLKSFIVRQHEKTDIKTCVIGLQEMNKTDKGNGTGTDSIDDMLNEVNTDYSTNYKQFVGDTEKWKDGKLIDKTAVSIIYDTAIFGEPLIDIKWDIPSGGRPRLLIVTKKHNLFFTMHGDNSPNNSRNMTKFNKFMQDINKKTVEDKINEILLEHKIEPYNIFLMADLNDRYDAIKNYKIRSQTIAYHGDAPLSCCYNWDSSCSDSRFMKKLSSKYIEQLNKKEAEAEEKAIADNKKLPEKKEKELIGFIPEEGEEEKEKPYGTCSDDPTENKITGNYVGSENKLKLPMPGEEGYVKNYRYRGDKVFGKLTDKIDSKIEIFSGKDYKGQDGKSQESDHQMVYAYFEYKQNNEEKSKEYKAMLGDIPENLNYNMSEEEKENLRTKDKLTTFLNQTTKGGRRRKRKTTRKHRRTHKKQKGGKKRTKKRSGRKTRRRHKA